MSCQRTAFFDKDVDKFGISGRTRREVDSAWNLTEQLAVIIGTINQDDDRARFDSEFLR